MGLDFDPNRDGLPDLTQFELPKSVGQVAYKLGLVKKIEIQTADPTDSKSHYVSREVFNDVAKIFGTDPAKTNKMTLVEQPPSSSDARVSQQFKETIPHNEGNKRVSIGQKGSIRKKQPQPRAKLTRSLPSLSSSRKDFNIQSPRGLSKSLTSLPSASRKNLQSLSSGVRARGDGTILAMQSVRVDQLIAKGLEGRSIDGVYSQIKLANDLRAKEANFAEAGDTQSSQEAGRLATRLENHLGIDQETAEKIVECGRENFVNFAGMAKAQLPNVKKAKNAAYFTRKQTGTPLALTVTPKGEFFIHPKGTPLGKGAEKKAFNVLGFNQKGVCTGKHADLSMFGKLGKNVNELWRGALHESQVAEKCQGHKHEKHVMRPYALKTKYKGNKGNQTQDKVRLIQKRYNSDVGKQAFEHERGEGRCTQMTKVMTGAAKGLVAMHENGLIHRDIKPGNIFIDSDGQGVVGDLGASVEVSKVLSGDGTAVFKPPESAEVRGEFSADTTGGDIWAFGASLWQALYADDERDTLFEKEDLMGGLTDEQVKNKLKLPAPETNEESRAQQAIRACLRIDPMERPSAAELVSILEGKNPPSHLDRAGQRQVAFEELQGAFQDQATLPILIEVNATIDGKSVTFERLPCQAVEKHRLSGHSIRQDEKFKRGTEKNIRIMEQCLTDETGKRALIKAAEKPLHWIHERAASHVDASLSDVMEDVGLDRISDESSKEKIARIRGALEANPSRAASRLVDELELITDHMLADAETLKRMAESPNEPLQVQGGFLGMLFEKVDSLQQSALDYQSRNIK